jgi:transcriptional regulator with XRE-family HTH domain
MIISKHGLAERIKKLREDLGLSQTELAEKLEIPRPSVSQIESAQRDVSSMELALLAKIFEISVDDLLSTDLEDNKCQKVKAGSKAPGLNKNKFKQVLLYILDKCGARANVGETVIYKLLYFSDFNYYELFEDYLTGASYRKISFGPAPCDFQEIVQEMIDKKELKKVTVEYYGKPQKKYLPLVNADVDAWNWSAREKEVIDNVIERLSFMDATVISDYSHGDIPWEVTTDKDIIDYDTVFYRKQPYSVRGYPEE